jgi:hypothetical protein
MPRLLFSNETVDLEFTGQDLSNMGDSLRLRLVGTEARSGYRDKIVSTLTCYSSGDGGTLDCPAVKLPACSEEATEGC